MKYAYLKDACLIDAQIPLKNQTIGSGTMYCHPDGGYTVSFLETHPYELGGSVKPQSITITKEPSVTGGYVYHVGGEESYYEFNSLLIRLNGFHKENKCYPLEFRNTMISNIIIIEEFSVMYHKWFKENAIYTTKARSPQPFEYSVDHIKGLENYCEDYKDGIDKDIEKISRLLEDHKSFFTKHHRGVPVTTLNDSELGSLSIEELNGTSEPEEISLVFSKGDEAIQLLVEMMSLSKGDEVEWGFRINRGNYASKNINSILYQLKTLRDDTEGMQVHALVKHVHDITKSCIDELKEKHYIDFYQLEGHSLSILLNMIIEKFDKK